ncbi:MAG: cytochrome c3 family protein, partial [Myxococcales bacterium]|nr:cytochrome c3 family protein [Myxococcales bacterium]
SHKLHAGELGMDCRYCHTGVEDTAHARIPPTQTCMNCHTQILTESPNLAPVRESWAKDTPVEWVRIHKIPDYAYFDHSAHISVGVGCESCHGRIDQMVEVRQVKPLSMGWCLECHNAPEQHLRPVSEVTTMGYEPEGGDQLALGKKLAEEKNVNPPIHCSGCHR